MTIVIVAVASFWFGFLVAALLAAAKVRDGNVR